jgi:hypothetical protein
MASSVPDYEKITLIVTGRVGSMCLCYSPLVRSAKSLGGKNALLCYFVAVVLLSWGKAWHHVHSNRFK